MGGGRTVVFLVEASKIREEVLPYLEGRSVVDLGCGGQKIVPWAVGVDDCSEGPIKELPAVDVRASVAPGGDLAAALGGRRFDVVFSSHTLEHVRAPIGETLRYWLELVVPGGRLILYLPDERYYVYDPSNPTARTPTHAHLLTRDTFVWHLEQVPNLEIELARMDLGPERYSFLVIARRTG
ncbi:MAG: methyltransferase domain-containing protein [Candidatus Binatia bacterium]